MGIVTWVTSWPMVHPAKAACVTASTPWPYALFRTGSSRLKGTASSRGCARAARQRGQHNGRGDAKGGTGGRMLVGDAGSHPQAAGRHLDEGGLLRWGRRERDVSG